MNEPTESAAGHEGVDDVRHALIVRECEQSLDRRLKVIREEMLPQLVTECMEKICQS